MLIGAVGVAVLPPAKRVVADPELHDELLERQAIIDYRFELGEQRSVEL